MKMFFKFFFAAADNSDAEVFQDEPIIAGLTESQLRSMDPDDRVAVLEAAHLDPYDYIYLVC